MSPRRCADGDSVFARCGSFWGWARLTARLLSRGGAGFHFPGVVVRIDGAVGVAGRPGLGKALSRSITRVISSIPGHRVVKRSSGGRRW